MDADVWNRLQPLRPGAHERFAAYADRGATPKDLERLAHETSPAFSRFVSLQRELRAKLRAKFDGDRITFATQQGFEQATAKAVADHRARRFAAAECTAWDACAGIGGEALALLEAGVPTVATDLSFEALRCAAANAAFARERGEVRAPFAALRAQALDPPVRSTAARPVAALFDPDRRTPEGRRLADPADWSPSLTEVLAVLGRGGFSGGCVKLPPSAEAAEAVLGRAERKPLTLEWISLGGRMRELALWTGALAEGDTAARRATVLGARPATVLGPLHPTDTCDVVPVGEDGWDGRTLVDADVALWQAELAATVARDAGLARIAPVAPRSFFLGGPDATAPAGCRAWRITGHAPLDRKQVRAVLRRLGIGPVTVKTRGDVPEADELVRKLRGPGERPGLLAVTEVAARAGKRARVVLVLEPA